jgi:hypothetical protein
MTLQTHKIERGRGWIIRYLEEQHPEPLEFPVLQVCLDERNFPLSNRELLKHVEFLRSAELLRVFPSGAKNPLNEVEQAKLLQRAVNNDSVARDVCIVIRNKGILLHEGKLTVDGVERI